MKYVILQGPDDIPVIVLCFAPLTHALLAEPFIARGCRPMSGGFAMFSPMGGDTLLAFGESTSLKVKSHPDDSVVLSAFYRATLNSARPSNLWSPPADPAAGGREGGLSAPAA
ncbi:MAG TPA: hypothetical protein PLF88_12130 [Opitutaceae bacterium]|nr:hypothetical protein [Opitutaceae bacterium]HRJ47526.1 hypothetical protein [Opitutaceae bacterium]